MSLFADYSPDKHGTPLDELEISKAVPSDLSALARLTAERESLDLGEVTERLAREIEIELSTQFLWAARTRGNTIAFARVRYADRPADYVANHQPAGWHLAGVIVDPEFRRRGVGHQLTLLRLDWLAERAAEAYYVAGDTNQPSIDLHTALGFEELTRDFFAPGISFQSGGGILFRIDLRRWKRERATRRG